MSWGVSERVSGVVESGRGLEGVWWWSGSGLKGVRKGSGRCLRVSERGLGGVWLASGRDLGNVRWGSCGCLVGI